MPENSQYYTRVIQSAAGLTKTKASEDPGVTEDDHGDFLPEIRFMLLGFRLLGFQLEDGKQEPRVATAQKVCKIIIAAILGLMLLTRTGCTGMVIIGPYYEDDGLATFEEKCGWSALVLLNVITFWSYFKACCCTKSIADTLKKLSQEVRAIAETEVGQQMKTTIRWWSMAVFLSPFFVCLILVVALCTQDFNNKAFMAKVMNQLTDDFETGKFVYYVVYHVNVLGMVLMFVVRSFLLAQFLCMCHVSSVLFGELYMEDPDKTSDAMQVFSPSINLTVYLRRHHSLCEMIFQVNDYMSNLLLVVILGESIFVILYTLIVVNGDMQADLIGWILQAMFWVYEIVILILVTILVARVNEQIIGSLISDAIVLQCQKQQIENVHMKYHLYITQVRAMSIGISCGSVFLLCKSSIFTIAGTIVTYYLIIDQMK